MIRTTYAEISLGNLAHNISVIHARLKPGTKYLAVVKANAYGHGMEQVVKRALEAGAEYIGVAFAEEGLRLRRAGIAGNILLLGPTDEAHMDAVIADELIVTVFAAETLLQLQAHAANLGKTVRVHYKVDTGMNRIGFTSEADFAAALALLKNCPNVVLDGLFTHFAVSERPDPSFTLGQSARFERYVSIAHAAGYTPILHAANSAAALHLPETQFDMVRGGIAMYGCHPAGHPVEGVDLRPVMRWHAALTYVKTVPAGEGVSYGLKYVTTKETRIGTIAVGYGDGYKRCLSGKAEVLVRGKRVPQVGTICMDQMMVDLSGVPDASVGDDAVLLGAQGAEEITADELADKIGTISYEILLSVSDRVPRVYVD